MILKFWRIGDEVYNGDPVEGAVEITEEDYKTLVLTQVVKSARAKRDTLLQTIIDAMNPMRWETLTDVQKDAWRAYRQALLDVPQQEGFPVNVVWPVPPWEEEGIND